MAMIRIIHYHRMIEQISRFKSKQFLCIPIPLIFYENTTILHNMKQTVSKLTHQGVLYLKYFGQRNLMKRAFSYQTLVPYA